MARSYLCQFALLAFVLFFTASAFATQRTVDNSPNSPGQFTSLQDAINASSPTHPRDTLLITGTNISYGTVSVDRPLVLIGAGYDPSSLETIVDQITLMSSDVTITGIHGGILFDLNNAAGDTLANIIVTRCRIGNPGALNFYASSQTGAGRLIDVKIYNNVIGQIGFNGCFTENQMRFDSLLYANNVTSRFGFNGNCIPQWQGTETFLIDHNLFIGVSGNCAIGSQECGIFSDQYGSNAWQSSAAVISNNIFHLQQIGGIRGCGQCSWFNNITTATGGANDSIAGTTGNQNLWAVDPALVLVNYPGGQFDWSHDYSLQPGSPAIGNGTSGTDIGPFDGLYPFDLGLPPAVPVVDFVNLSRSAVPQDSTIYLHFDAKVRP